MRHLPGPGIEPMSPALAGGFLTTTPPGKSSALNSFLLHFFLYDSSPYIVSLYGVHISTGFLYSFYSLLAPLFGCFQLIFILTYWFFLFLGQVCCWISVLNSLVYALYCVRAKSPPSCVTLCDLMDCSPLGSSVHGIHQARILEWVAMYSSRGSSRPRDHTWVSYLSCTGRRVP